MTSPNKDLGRAGPVCPFVLEALERKTLWLAPEHLSDRSVLDVAELINRYRRILVQAQPTQGDGVNYKSLVVVLTDLSAERAKTYMDDVQIQDLKRHSYVEDGVVIGDFTSGTRELRSQPELSTIQGTRAVPADEASVVSDWVFFLDNEDWLNLWARRFGESAVRTLAEQLRRTNWRRLES